ncbi:hypothetical protein PVAP13_5NG123100 [Panicum virgatum]|uniref:Uncharacterized protein n=1 Tax=Panicum virgatum TaxID=38727 RepID=A0A8T0RQQ9_PANVG|nr:hypothetical protein PVAP13_5NG123100 [Panicum virgatum]
MCLVATVGNLGPGDGAIGGAHGRLRYAHPSPAPAQRCARLPPPPGLFRFPYTCRRRPPYCRPFHRSGGRYPPHTGSAVGGPTAIVGGAATAPQGRGRTGGRRPVFGPSSAAQAIGSAAVGPNRRPSRPRHRPLPWKTYAAQGWVPHFQPPPPAFIRCAGRPPAFPRCTFCARLLRDPASRRASLPGRRPPSFLAAATVRPHPPCRPVSRARPPPGSASSPHTSSPVHPDSFTLPSASSTPALPPRREPAPLPPRRGARGRRAEQSGVRGGSGTAAEARAS